VLCFLFLVRCDQEPAHICDFVLEHECKSDYVRYLCPRFCQMNVCSSNKPSWVIIFIQEAEFIPLGIPFFLKIYILLLVTSLYKMTLSVYWNLRTSSLYVGEFMSAFVCILSYPRPILAFSNAHSYYYYQYHDHMMKIERMNIKRREIIIKKSCVIFFCPILLRIEPSVIFLLLREKRTRRSIKLIFCRTIFSYTLTVR
jgi:hypothetical protein